MIFDDADGLNFLPAYGTLRDLFADPSLASDEEYAEPLRAYLREDSILPLPLYRYYEREPRPSVTVIGGRLKELLR